MLQQDEPEDFVIATGETHTVRDCVEVAFDHVGLDWEEHVVIDESLMRPAEVDLLVGDPTKAREQLGRTDDDLRRAHRLMVDADLALLSAARLPGSRARRSAIARR